MEVRRCRDAAEFLERAELWLVQREAENNLILGIARQLRDPNHPYQDPIYLATVEDNGRVVGCGYRTPPYKFGITDMPTSAVPLLVEDAADVYSTIPAILGPEVQATKFAELWSLRFGGLWNVGTRQRIYQLERVIFPETRAPGSMRVAADADRDRVAEFVRGFSSETHQFGGEPDARAQRLVTAGAIYLWEDGEVRSMASSSGETSNGVRIGYVYTPSALRGRGYATTLVATLSQRMLDEGRTFCFLYTELANPSSNAIYKRIGYEPVCDVVDVEFASTS